MCITSRSQTFIFTFSNSSNFFRQTFSQIKGNEGKWPKGKEMCKKEKKWRFRRWRVNENNYRTLDFQCLSVNKKKIKGFLKTILAIEHPQKSVFTRGFYENANLKPVYLRVESKMEKMNHIDVVYRFKIWNFYIYDFQFPAPFFRPLSLKQRKMWKSLQNSTFLK